MSSLMIDGGTAEVKSCIVRLEGILRIVELMLTSLRRDGRSYNDSVPSFLFEWPSVVIF
jgi:hypothetical protein